MNFGASAASEYDYVRLFRILVEITLFATHGQTTTCPQEKTIFAQRRKDAKIRINLKRTDGLKNEDEQELDSS